MSWMDDVFGGGNENGFAGSPEVGPEHAQAVNSQSSTWGGGDTGLSYSADTGFNVTPEQSARIIGSPEIGSNRPIANSFVQSALNRAVDFFSGRRAAEGEIELGRLSPGSFVADVAGVAKTLAQGNTLSGSQTASLLGSGMMALAPPVISAPAAIVRMLQAAGVPMENKPLADSPLWNEAGPPVPGEPYKMGQAAPPTQDVIDRILEGRDKTLPYLLQQPQGAFPDTQAEQALKGPLLTALLKAHGLG